MYNYLFVGDFDNLIAVNAELAGAEAFENALTDIDFLDIKCRRFSGKIGNFADSLLVDGHDVLAMELKVEVDDFLQANQLFWLHEDFMVIDHVSLRQCVSNVLRK